MKQDPKLRSKKIPGVKSAANAKTSLKSTPAWKFLLPLILIAAVTWILYRPAIHNGFTNWDDPAYVLENPHVKQLNSDNIGYFFTNPSASNYHPLTMISLAIDYSLTPSQNKLPNDTGKLEATRFHTTNVILHILNVILVYLFVFFLSRRHILAATLTALLFAIHPMHVESVAWIAERKDVLYAFFFVVALISYLKYLENKAIKYLVITFILFILSLLSKPSAVVFPLILVAIDYFRARKFTTRTWTEKIPFFILSIVFGLITVLIQSKEAIGDIRAFSVLQRLMFASYGFMMYVVKLAVPVKLSAFYPYPALATSGYLPVIYYLSPVMVIIIGALTWFSIRFTRVIVFGVLFFLFSLVLVLQFISVGSAIMADRYSYVASIGLFFILSWYFDRVFTNHQGVLHSWRWVITGFLVIYIVFIVKIAREQNRIWKNTETLWSDVISKYPQADVSYKNRGNYYGALNLTDKALNDYQIYIKLKPDDPRAFSNLGNIYGLRNETDKALNAYSRSIALDSINEETYLNRAITFAKARKFDAALKDYDKTLILKPGRLEVYVNRSYTLLEMGRYEDAIKDYSLLIQNFPANDDFYLRRGICYYMLKRNQDALNDFSQAISLNPSNANAYFNSSVILNKQNDFKKAYQYALRAKSLKYRVEDSYLEGLKSKQ